MLQQVGGSGHLPSRGAVRPWSRRRQASYRCASGQRLFQRRGAWQPHLWWQDGRPEGSTAHTAPAAAGSSNIQADAKQAALRRHAQLPTA